MSINNYSVIAMNGKQVNLEDYLDQVILIVNTASKCGFTPQYEDLQRLYEKYKDKNFTILGFPCNQFGEQEPENNDKVQSFCTLNYGVTFPLFQKVNVRGSEAHPLFKHLTQSLPYKGMDNNDPSSKILLSMLNEKYPEYLMDDSIKWNFTKFLINKKGNPIKRYEPTHSFDDLETDIKLLIKF